MFIKFSLSALICVLLLGAPPLALDNGASLNKPIPEDARRAFARGLKLEESDNYQEALAEFKKAYEIAPNFVRARIEYVMADSYFLQQETQVRAEYLALMTKEPYNPIYPLALALGQTYGPQKSREEWLEKTATLASDWAWGHYAKAQLTSPEQREAALAEVLKTIELDPDAMQAYSTAAAILEKLKRFDEADALAAKLAASDEKRTEGLVLVWRLQLARAGKSDESKAKLKHELEQRISDGTMLPAVYSAYTTLLMDNEGAKRVEALILKIDPKWYPERGTIHIGLKFDSSGMQRVTYIYAGWQAHLSKMLHDVQLFNVDPKLQIGSMEKILLMNPGITLRHEITRDLLTESIAAADLKRTLNYGEALLKDNPNDVHTLISLTKALTGRPDDSARAFEYARRAMSLTAAFHPVEKSPDVDANIFAAFFSEEMTKDYYNDQRCQVLNTYAALLSKVSKDKEAEDTLKSSLALSRSEGSLNELEKIERKLGHGEEADKLAAEAKTLWMGKITKDFTNEPAKDFEVTTLDGHKVKLSALKGKTVIVSFWATWCFPCREEMPLLADLYKKYNSRGLEIVAISTDVPEDRSKVVAFASENKLTFAITIDQAVALAYGVSEYPTIYFIDPEGRLRYKTSGFDPTSGARDLKFVVDEIMK